MPHVLQRHRNHNKDGPRTGGKADMRAEGKRRYRFEERDKQTGNVKRQGVELRLGIRPDKDQQRFNRVGRERGKGSKKCKEGWALRSDRSRRCPFDIKYDDVAFSPKIRLSSSNVQT